MVLIISAQKVQKRASVRESDPKEEKRKRGWGCLVFGCRKGFSLDFGFRVFGVRLSERVQFRLRI